MFMFKDKRWRQWFLPLVLTIALVGSVFWGYQEMQTRQKLQNRAESQYQKAFYDLTWHLNNISGQLAQVLVCSSNEQASLSLATVWRQVFAAQANIGSLPLALVPLTQTESFLDNTSIITHFLLGQLAKGQDGLTAENNKKLEDLYRNSLTLTQELSKLGSKILSQELSWTEVETAAFAVGRSLEDNTVLNGFKLMEKKLEQYPEINIADDFGSLEPPTKKISGKDEISVQEAEGIALLWWFPEPQGRKATLTYEGIGDIPTYGMEISPLKGEAGPVYLDVSKLDGSVVWAMKARPVEISKLDVSTGAEQARKFLVEHDLLDFALVQSQKEDHVGVYTFVPQQGEVLLYPDQVKLEVALDNGEILGFEGTPYYMFHQTRVIPPAKLTQEHLRSFINSRLKVEAIRLALIVNTWGQEILTWEVRGTFYEETFAIFYNAESGCEEAIVRITPPPEFSFTVEG